MSTTQSERLRGLLEPLVSARDLDLEEVQLTPAGKRRVLRVVVDSDAGVELDACAELSRAVSERLDETDVMGATPYVLEVTSPGADRPLTEHRHYRRATGRLVRLRLTAGGELVARITGVDQDGLDLEVPGVKGRKPTTRRLAFTEIAKAQVELEFNRRSAPGESAGAGHGDPDAAGVDDTVDADVADDQEATDEADEAVDVDVHDDGKEEA